MRLRLRSVDVSGAAEKVDAARRRIASASKV